MTSSELRATIQKLIDDEKVSQAELSRELEVSTTMVSLWLADKYKHNTRPFEEKLVAWLRLLPPDRAMTFRDHNRLLTIYTILDDADDEQSIIATLFQQRGRAATASSD